MIFGYRRNRNLGVVIMTVFCTLLMAGGSAAQDSAIEGIWLPDGSRSQRVPVNLPYTVEGRRIALEWEATHDPVEDDPGLYCQSPGMPSIALSGAGYPVEVAVTADQVLILMEAHQQIRRIFLDSSHPGSLFPQRNGHSIGHWEDNTLVVETVGIRAITFGSVPHSNQLSVVERLRVIDGGNTLIDEVTINDPLMYSEPIIVERYFTVAPMDTRMLEYECTEAMWIEHEESRGREPFAL